MSLAEYQEKFRQLVVNIRNARASPHKICMLLAVLDLARAGALTINRIEFTPPLLERYHAFFAAVKGVGDHSNPYFPFFHLAGPLRSRTPSFWHLKALPGRELILSSMSTARSPSDITNNIAYAELDPELFELLQDPSSVDALTEAVSSHWFDRGLHDLRTVVELSGRVSRYENALRSGSELKAQETKKQHRLHTSGTQHSAESSPKLMTSGAQQQVYAFCCQQVIRWSRPHTFIPLVKRATTIHAMGSR